MSLKNEIFQEVLFTCVALLLATTLVPRPVHNSLLRPYVQPKLDHHSMLCR